MIQSNGLIISNGGVGNHGSRPVLLANTQTNGTMSPGSANTPPLARDDIREVQKRLRGTGLGLSLSRKFAALLGGHVGVESTEGKGSRFYVVIPGRYPGVQGAAL